MTHSLSEDFEQGGFRVGGGGGGVADALLRRDLTLSPTNKRGPYFGIIL